MFDHRMYSDLFRSWYPSRGTTLPDSRYGVSVLVAPQGGPVFRCIGVWHLLPTENGGKRNVFLDVLDQAGNRIQAAEIEWGWEGQRPGQVTRPAVIDKPANEPGTNISLDFPQTVFVSVGLPDRPSETVFGLHTRHPDEAGGNTLGHHSFYVVFQLREAGQPLPPPPVDKIVSVPVNPGGRIEWVVGPDGEIKGTKYVAG